MKKRFWEITVWWEDQEPRIFHLECEKYPMEVIITVAQKIMEEYGAYEYAVKQVWEEEIR